MGTGGNGLRQTLEGDDNAEAEQSTRELMELVRVGEHVPGCMELDPLIVERSVGESITSKPNFALKYYTHFLNCMAAKGSPNFDTLEKSGMEISHDKTHWNWRSKIELDKTMRHWKPRRSWTEVLT